jgi:hypothetical protein
MTDKADDEPCPGEEIASELMRIADRVRQGPMDPTELGQVAARVEAIAQLVSERTDANPGIAERLEQLAGKLRNPPVRKNGSA